MLGLRSDRDRKLTRDYSSILIQLASPTAIRSWSYGEVTKPETINYRTFKPEKDGLFCERIFGPVKDWECNCGKYKRIRYRGIVCDKCGVEVTQSKVRRERLGHIELAVPVAHIWFFKGLPSRIGHLLDMKLKDLERVLYYESYVVLDAGNSGMKEGELLTEDEYDELHTSIEGLKMRVGMGAESIKELLQNLTLPELAERLKEQARTETSVQRKKNVLKRLKIVNAFLNSNNDPEWMVLDCIPVLPPDLRPLVPLDGGRFATSDLNDLYRRVINRNNRLKKLIEIKAPGVILRNEKRMLQEAVDALFDNGRRSRAVKGQGNRPLKSLSDMLKGKKGRFRQNLLGKRVDYSGRSVIVVGPELKLYQCGLPKSMALELFKPFIIRKLEEKGYVQTVKSAKKLVEKQRPEVWDILEEIITDHPVLLNRAPTLHRLGIQAFEPVLVEGKAIRIHPLVCAAFNADFDGDQMAVHVPLGYEAQLESRVLMLAPNNILSPANGEPVATPSQDMVLGLYYLTKSRVGDKGEGKIFYDGRDVISAYEHGLISMHALVKVRIKGKLIETTMGRILFNEIVPEEMGYLNGELSKKHLAKIVGQVHSKIGTTRAMKFLDDLKVLGFEQATTAGLTISIDDVLVPTDKEAIVAKAQEKVNGIRDQHQKGIITNRERYNKVIDTWTEVSDTVANLMFDYLEKDRQGFNPVHMMHASGARGSRDQIRQLGAMRGLMAKPQKKLTGGVGEIIEQPILSNFRDGLTVLEYFISTHGARKGLADTALKTADAGYLTRRLVDVAQDIVVTQHDCGSILGLDVTAIKEGEEIIESLSDRVRGRTLADDIVDDQGELVAEAGDLIDADLAARIEEHGIERVRIRSVLTCEAKWGVCALCYGHNLAEHKLVDMGEPVGVIAAQSIGEPGTQLTLRTFHIGGTASRIAEQSVKEAVADGVIEFSKDVELVKHHSGKQIAIGRKGEIRLVIKSGVTRSHLAVPYGAVVHVKNGQKIKKGIPIFEWDPYSDQIMTKVDGVVHYNDIVDGVTLSEQVDEKTGRRQMTIKESTNKNLHPTIIITTKAGKKKEEYIIPTGSILQVYDGDAVLRADSLCKIPRDIGQTRDITGGLPRVAELFEARHPKDAATVTQIDGIVTFGGVSRGMRKIVITPEGADASEAKEYLIPHGRHVRTYEGEHVLAGDRLTEGAVDPMDILAIKGVNAVQSYLVNAIQEVYRLQGVKIDDKHVEIIVSRMLQKVKITDPGDTAFLEDELATKADVRAINEELQARNRERRERGEEELKPAVFEPQLLGITKASLSTDSFISAASFQETTRVLTEAAIHSKRDELRSLKENVIMGHLISAGTGLSRLKHLAVEEPEEDDEIFNAAPREKNEDGDEGEEMVSQAS